MKRNISLEWLDEASEAEVAELNPETLATLASELTEAKRRLAEREAAFHAGAYRRYEQAPDFFGTAHVDDGAYCVKVEVPKRVEWDRDKILRICQALEDSGEDPTEFVTFEPKIAESSYKAWPERFRSLFTPARTVKPGKAKIAFIRKEAA